MYVNMQATTGSSGRETYSNITVMGLSTILGFRARFRLSAGQRTAEMA